jgi:hypothetical protein
MPAIVRSMRVRRIAWMTAAKVAVTLALMPPTNRGGPVEYRTSAPLPGLEPGAPVVLAGTLIGYISHIARHGDATVLHVRFERGAERLPGSRIVQLRPLGLQGAIALEMLPAPRGTTWPFVRGGLLHVRPWSLPDPTAADAPAAGWDEPPEPARMPQWMPRAAPLSRPHTSA